MNGLFGLELPAPVNFVIAFVVVLALIGAATWLVRRFGAARLEAGARNRQPRLAVIDSAAVDGRRKLVIIRRDNVEHLLMIGGPTDVVVETNILRAAAAVPRDVPATRANGGETLPRAMPLPDATHWPLQPEPAAAAAAAASPVSVAAPPPPPPARPERLRADEAAQWPVQSEPTPPSAPAVRPQRSDAAIAGPAAETPPQPVAAPAAPAPRPSQPAPRPSQPAPARVVAKAAPPVQIDPQIAAVNDANLASMAHQLEAALRRPAQAEAVPPAEPRRIEPKLVPPAPRPAPRPAAVASAAHVATQQKPPFESLEQEMASLLGRPGKT